MTDVSDRAGASGLAGEESTSKAAEVQQKVQEGASQVLGQVEQARGQMGERLREQVDTRSTQAGSQLHSTADAVRRTSEQLRTDGKDGPAKMADAVAERAERLGDYMTDANADRMLRDVEDFARRQPVVFALGGAMLGFLASRFLKASSSRRYQGNGYEYRGYQDYRAGLEGYEASMALPTSTGLPPHAETSAPLGTEFPATDLPKAQKPPKQTSRGGSGGNAN